MGNKVACEEFFGTKFKETKREDLEKEAVKFMKTGCKIKVRSQIMMLAQEVGTLWIQNGQMILQFTKEEMMEKMKGMMGGMMGDEQLNEMAKVFEKEPDKYFMMFPISDKYDGFSHWGIRNNEPIKDGKVLNVAEGAGKESAIGKFWIMFLQWLPDIQTLLFGFEKLGLENNERFKEVEEVAVEIREGMVALLFKYPAEYGALAQRPFVLMKFEKLEEKDFLEVPKEHVFKIDKKFLDQLM